MISSPGDGDIRRILERIGQATPECIAVIQPDGTELRCGELLQMAQIIADSIPSGYSRIAIRISNDLSTLVALHGAWLAGSAVVAISHLVPPDEIDRRLVETRSEALLTPDEGLVELTSLAEPKTVKASEDALILFTSGTTGRPKAAVLSARALGASLSGVAIGSGVPHHGRPLVDPPRAPSPVFTPLAHMSGVLGVLTPWYLGKPLMILPRFRSEDVLDLAKSHGFTVLNLTPAMIYDLAYHPDDRSLSAVRMVCVGTDRLPLATRIRFEDRFGIPVLENYGQTEFGGAIALERYDDVLAGIRPPGSVGRIVPGAEVVIVDRSGSPMAVGDVGEIWARGSSAMSGYLRDSASAPDGARDGWIATGDLGSLDENQILTVHGRLRDVVICGGFNVYPAMVESALNAVAGVIDSAVVGLQDDRLGEVPIAAIVLAPGHMTNVDEVHSQLRSALAPYEVPRLIVATAAIPRTGNGKVDRPAVLRLCVEA